MTVLKELTWENHKKAETTAFMKRLAKRQLSPKEYYTFLSNQYMMYQALEEAVDRLHLIDDIPSIRRVDAIDADLKELEATHGFDYAKMMDSGLEYIDHIKSISDDSDKLIAHCYVRYFGDLSGGQILKRLVHGSGNCYEFGEEVDTLKQKFTEKLKEDMAAEANVCFELMIDFLNEIEERFSNGSLG